MTMSKRFIEMEIIRLEGEMTGDAQFVLRRFSVFLAGRQ